MKAASGTDHAPSALAAHGAVAPPLAIERAGAAALALVCAIYLALVFYYWAHIGPYIVDDAFIYFRYADNFAHGHGLVYNVGERVAGYTGVSWMLLLAAAAWLGLPLIGFAQAVGVGCAVLTLIVLSRLALRLTRWRPAAWLCPLLLATNRSYCVWSIEGLETPAFALVLVLTLQRWLAAEARGFRTRVPGLGGLAALLALTRPEGFGFVALMGLGLLWESARGERPYRVLLPDALAFLALAGALLGWRWLYYGDLLPNTFYAKVVQLQPARGLEYLAGLSVANGLLWYAPLVLLGAFAFAAPGPFATPRRWTLAVVALYAVYLALIGGDYFEFRCFVPVLPIWSLWTIEGSRRLTRWLASPKLGPALLGASVLLWLGANARSVLDPPEADLTRTTPEAEVDYTRTFAQVGRWMALNLPGDERIAIRPAGVIAYLSRAKCLDIVGLCDREIARDDALISLDQSIGHQRLVTREYLVRRGVTYFVGHPHVSAFPARPGRGLVSIELEPGRFLVMHRLAPDASFEDRIYRLDEHAGSIRGWHPVERRSLPRERDPHDPRAGQAGAGPGRAELAGAAP